jgi:predicted PurR-regulated permease PerM
MSANPLLPNDDSRVLRLAVEAVIRIGLLAALVLWCFDIARPFLVPIVWGVIIAVAVYPGYRRFEARLGDRQGLAATLFTLLMLTALLGPSLLLAGSLIDGARQAAAALQAGTFSVPAPPEGVASWPLIGDELSRFWQLAAQNLGAALREAGPVLKGAGQWLLGLAATLGTGVLQFIVAIVIAGVLLAHAAAGGRAARSVALRLAPEHGLGYVETASKIVHSVTTGILGVALLQGVLAGIGFMMAGVPAAGLLTLVCIFLGVIQLGVVVVLVPVAIWLFSTADTTTAVAFLVYAILIAPIDNILKPILLGRGVKVPIVVVFIGAIGGFLSTGIIGLFVGAVIFTLGYGLLLAWLRPNERSVTGLEGRR